MSEQLNAILAKLLGWMEDGAIWASKEVPLYVEELLRWGVAKSIVVLVIGVIFGAVTFFVTKQFVELYKKDESYDRDFWWLPIVFSGLIGGGVSLKLLISNTLNLVQILVAPRVWLLEYVDELIGK